MSKKAEPQESPMSSQTTLTNCSPLSQLGLILYGSIPPFSGQWVEIWKFCGERGRKVPYKPLLQWPATPPLTIFPPSLFDLKLFLVITQSQRASPLAQRVNNLPARDTGDGGSIPGSGKSPGGRYGNPLQDSCLKNPRYQRDLVGCSPKGHKELDTTEQLSLRAQSQSLLQKVP